MVHCILAVVFGDNEARICTNTDFETMLVLHTVKVNCFEAQKVVMLAMDVKVIKASHCQDSWV